ncbi:sushi, von Willebrand factor type A, EGF and pentraxin domain-containing protein 1-like [Daphnia carinata]|uniref:sushi, von Willebrand factor type A, EGF and pentraxin domain-containing protein 1-like n=1 Tax=Daphnia carinata TaxID=120202 RepID=UPI0028689BC7|nr:sushi, von Willebrand factor type A, EGF and pentraxin domain-containing protein 1-like [Daphnia carinata]
MMLYLVKLVYIVSTMVEMNCQTFTTKDVRINIPVTNEISIRDPFAASDTPMEEPKMYCDLPSPIPNGWIDITDNLPLKMSTVGRSIIYRCNTNARLIGASSATCEKGGNWSKNPPECLSPCIVPVVEHGVVRNESSGSTLFHGGKLTIDCIDSYQPVHGQITSTCNNGTWNVIPRCEPAPRGNCDRPEIPNGMFVQIDGRNVTHNQTYVPGTEIFYKCADPNRRLIDNSDSEVTHSRLVCDTATRSWKGTLLTCEATCGSLIPLIRLKLLAADAPELRNIKLDGPDLVGERYKVGTNASVYCKPAENVVHPTATANNGLVVCQSNGTWGGSFPICVRSVGGRLKLLTFYIILTSSAIGLIFFLMLVWIYNKCGHHKTSPDVGNDNSNNENSNDAQGMRAELLRQIGRQSFYSLDETPDGGHHGYATIHRPGTLRRQSALIVHYGKNRTTSQYGKLG